jgi:uncharacterized iron-regulated membrane protein
MATQRTLRMLFSVHAWAGIVTGLLLFVVCLSGAIVVFKHEIDLWANPTLAGLPHVPEHARAPLQQVHDAVRVAHPAARIESIWPPDAVTPVHMVFVRHADGSREKLAVRADDASLIGPVESQLGQYLRSLHVFLFVGPRWIVGFLGVVMLVLIATGFVIHRKIIAELYTQRWRQSLRTLFSDTHKAAAIWGLAFHIVIAFTGAWLGLKPVFVGAWDAVFSPPAAVATARPVGLMSAAATLDLDRLATNARASVPGLQMRFISWTRHVDGTPAVRFAGRIDGHLASNAHVVVAAGDGRVLSALDPRAVGFWAVVDGLMEPLHFGDFGGIWLKWLYFFLGLTPALLSISGTLLWLDKRREAETAWSHASA